MKVLFFARLREALGDGDSLTLPAHVHPATVADLRSWLRSGDGELARVMNEPNILCAVNQQVVADDHELREDDEIAFLPPVTGG